MDRSDAKILQHFEGIITDKVVRYATDVVLEESKYIFITGKGKSRRGYCTHCREEYFVIGGRHNEYMYCPKCKSKCTVKLAGYSRQYMYDYGTMLTYKKLNKNAMLAVYCYVERSYKQSYKDVETKVKVQAKYYFEIDNAEMYEQDYWSKEWKPQRGIYNFYHKKQHYGAYSEDLQSLEKACKNTAFRHIYKCFINANDESHSIEKLALYCKYPKIEYVIKAGYYELMDKYIKGYSTGGTISWRSKTLPKFLRLSQSSYNKIKGMSITDFKELFYIQQVEKSGHPWDGEQLTVLKNACQTYQMEELNEIMGYLTIEKIVNYIEKQMQKKDWCHNGMGMAERYYSRHVMFRDWVDYLDQCKSLKYDLHDDAIMRPKDLQLAHTKTSELIAYQKNKALDEKIAARLKELNEQYGFKFGNLIIRPAASSGELIKEGSKLGHCVGGYAKRHASGETTILLIRKIDNPDTPFFTVEVRENTLIQARGYKQISYEKVPAVHEFIKQFKQQKLNERIQKAS